MQMIRDEFSIVLLRSSVYHIDD